MGGEWSVVFVDAGLAHDKDNRVMAPGGDKYSGTFSTSRRCHHRHGRSMARLAGAHAAAA